MTSHRRSNSRSRPDHRGDYVRIGVYDEEDDRSKEIRAALRAPSGNVSIATVATLMIMCALFVAGVNIYMNTVAKQSLPQLQLDMSAQNDLLAFHKADISDGEGAHPVPFPHHSPHQNLREADKKKIKSHNRKVQPRDQLALNVKTTLANITCTGLCPPLDFAGSQTDYVQIMLDRHQTMVDRRQRSTRHPPPMPFEQMASYAEVPRDAAMKDVNMTESVLKKYWKTIDGWTDARHMMKASVGQHSIARLVKVIKSVRITRAYIAQHDSLVAELSGGQLCLMLPHGKEHGRPTVAFHFGTLIDLNRMPLMASRRIDVERELRAVADEGLARGVHRYNGSVSCITVGEKRTCSAVDGRIEFIVILWSGFSHVQPVSWPWTSIPPSPSRCATLRSHRLFGNPPLLMDLVETAIFDYMALMNGRKHTHMFTGVHPPAMLMGNNVNAFHHTATTHLQTLSPLFECCQVRRHFHATLTREWERDPAVGLKTRLRVMGEPAVEHIEGINGRMANVLRVVAACIEKHGEHYVMQDDKF